MIGRRVGAVLLLAAAAITAVAVFLPLWWVFASSLRPGNTYVDFLTPLSWRAFIPVGGEFTNYAALLSGPFALGLLNSFLVAGLTIFFGLVIAVPAAYALAAIDFRRRGVIFGFIVLVAMIPFDAIAIPLSSLFNDWQLSGTLRRPGAARGGERLRDLRPAAVLPRHPVGAEGRGPGGRARPSRHAVADHSAALPAGPDRGRDDALPCPSGRPTCGRC